MSKPKPGAVGTLAEIEAEIERLERERERFLSPTERDRRQIRRTQILGAWAAERFQLSADDMAALRAHAGEEGWLFSAEVLAADGIEPAHDGWRLRARPGAVRDDGRER